MGASKDDITESTRLDIFCAQHDEAWRTYVRPGCPSSLWQHLDDEGEAFPTQLDMDDLERHMREEHATFEREESALGGFRLVAKGRSAGALATWLSGAFSTGMRPRRSDSGGEAG
jgi:hypothetical protein